MPLFRKKPVVIEAHQWIKNGDHPQDDAPVIRTWAGGLIVELGEGRVVRAYIGSGDEVKGGNMSCNECGAALRWHGWIKTLEGGHIVCPYDWIVTGVKGEMYPCKPDIFAATYERVDPNGAAES